MTGTVLTYAVAVQQLAPPSAEQRRVIPRRWHGARRSAADRNQKPSRRGNWSKPHRLMVLWNAA